MNIAEAREILGFADSCNHVPLFVGYHGIGKSEIVKQYAEENNMHCEVLILSLMDESDLLGIPHKEEHDGVIFTSWAAPAWLHRIIDAAKKGKRSILFLDELNRSPSSVLGASLQLILDKRLNDHILPTDTLMVAAINPEDGDYNVNSLDPAVLDRMVVCDLEADPVAWISWAKQAEVNGKVVDFIIKNPNKIHTKPSDNSKGASPRSWTRLATYISFVEEKQIPINTYYIKGTIGESLAAEFILFYNNYTKNISPDEIIELVENHPDDDLQSCVVVVEDAIKELEAIQKSELAVSLEKRYKPLFNKVDIIYENVVSSLKYPANFNKASLMPYLVYLYALPIESLAAYIKNLKNDDNELFMKLAAYDGEINNKGLFKRVLGK